ncbi:MAG: NAD-dependent epimerase/dehydratase family protein [Candidatus Methanofastidiosia archaeon]
MLVKDVAKAFALALENEDASIHQTYIVSDEKAYSYNQVYGMLAELSGRKAPRLHLPKLLAKILIAPIQAINNVIGNYNFLYNTSTIEVVSVDRAYSIEKIKGELGFKPDYDLHSGLEEIINWYKDNGYI